MTERRISICLLLTLFAGLLVGFYIGLAQPRGPGPHEMTPEMLIEAEKGFKLYAAKKVKDRVRITVLDGLDVDVDIVSEYWHASYGFAEIAEVPRGFWLSRDEFQIYRYDDHHFFVIIRDRYITDLKRNRPPVSERATK
jgi:hypothetical protein